MLSIPKVLQDKLPISWERLEVIEIFFLHAVSHIWKLQIDPVILDGCCQA